MRLDVNGENTVVLVTLSAKNVRELAARADEPTRSSAMWTGNAYRDGDPLYHVALIVRVEPDVDHYRDPQRVPDRHWLVRPEALMLFEHADQGLRSSYPRTHRSSE